MSLSMDDMIEYTTNIFESNGIKRIYEIFDEKIKFAVVDDEDLAFVTVEKVSSFSDIAQITRTRFEEITQKWVKENSTDDLKIRLDTVQFLESDGIATQCRYTANQTQFIGGDEEISLIKKLISMTLVQKENNETQNMMVKALKKRLEEIKE